MTEDLLRAFPPIVRADARLLILGSMPGARSLAEARYYAHPRNQFWGLLGAVLGTELAGLSDEARAAALVAHRVTLWDVVAAARREGSLDAALREVAVRDLCGFVADLPGLRAVAFNGATAARLGRRALGATALALIDLPSSSPAFTLPFEAKLARWRALVPHLD